MSEGLGRSRGVQPGEPQADLRVIPRALLRTLERDPPAAALRVGRRHPRTTARAVDRHPPATAHARASPGQSARRRRTARAERGMERRGVAQVQAAMPQAMPTCRHDRRRKPQVVHATTRGIAPIVGGIQEVGDPAGGVRRSDRRAGHPGKTELRRSRSTIDERTGPEHGSNQQETRTGHAPDAPVTGRDRRPPPPENSRPQRPTPDAGPPPSDAPRGPATKKPCSRATAQSARA